MDTGAAAAAFSPPIFRPALPSFTWQTPRATFGVLIVRQRRCSLRSSVSLFAALHAPSFLPVRNTRIRSFSPISLREVSLARVYDRNSFTRSSPVAQRNERCFFAWLIRGIKCARGLATGIRIFDPFFLSLSISLSFFLSTSASLRASIEKKSPQNSTVYVGKKSDDDFYEASPYLRGIKG